MICKACKDIKLIPSLIPVKGKVFSIVDWNVCFQCLGGTRKPFRASHPLVVVPIDGKLSVVKATVNKRRY